MDENHSLQTCRQKLNAVGDAVYVLGGKWRLRIIIAIREGHHRFNELQRTIDGISAKVLSGELKELELNGLVRRNVDPGPPVVVEYVLTPYSDSLNSVLGALSHWGEQHREKLVSERR